MMASAHRQKDSRGDSGDVPVNCLSIARRLSMVLTLVFAEVLTAYSVVAAEPIRVEIPVEVSVRTNTLVLADLLPATAPRDLKSLAASIDLGSAPQIGSKRYLSRDFIVSTLDSAELLPSSFSVPDFVSVYRIARRITRDEVLAAVQDTARINPSLSSIDTSTLALDISVDVPNRDPQLEVIQTIVDAPLHCVHFRLAARAAPTAVPFFATAHLTSDSLVSAPRNSPRVLSLAPVPRDIALAPILVSTGTVARLHVHSANSDMQLFVKPLQRGRLGETIRVELLGTHKVLQGRVIAAGQLDATF